MIKRLPQNQWVKVESGFLWSSLASKVEHLLFYSFILFLPTQFGKHFWFDFSFVLGSRIDYLSPTLYVTDMFLVFLFFIVLLKRKINVSPLFSLFVLFLSVGIFFSKNPFVGWYELAKFLELSFLAWYVAHVGLSKFVVGALFAVGIVFQTILALLQLLHQGSLGGPLYFLGERSFSSTTPGIANASIQGELILRPYGTFSHPNMFAGFLLIATIFVMYFLSKKTISQGVVSFVSLVFGTLGLALSLSRVAIVAWALVGAFAFLMVFRERISKYFFMLFISALTTLLIVSVFFREFVYRILSFSFGTSLAERFLLARYALSLFISSPFFGVGLGNFIPSLPSVAHYAIILQPVHNIYLLIASETGFVGLSAAVIFFSTLIAGLIKKWKRADIAEKNKTLLLLLCFGTTFFIGFFDHYFLTLQQGQLLLSFVIGLALREISFDTIQG